MTTTPLELRRPSERVAEVLLARPEARNAFDGALVAALTETFHALGRDPGLRVVVLGAHGGVFCAGADLRWMRAMAGATPEENRTDARALAELLAALDSCPVPVVARVQGDCFGGGVGLLAACDVVVASEAARFCLSEARLGLVPATIGPYLVRAIGARAVRRYAVTAERFGAAEAHRLGLVHERCAPEALDAAVHAIVEAITGNGPAAVRGCKRLVGELAGRPITSELREETARLIADVRGGPEAREGMAAFLEGRAPSWR